MDFGKLEKLEFSGIRGNGLGQQVQQMHEEFEEIYKVFSECSYDCLDLQSPVGLGGANSQALPLFSPLCLAAAPKKILKDLLGSVVLVVLLFIVGVRRDCHPCVIKKDQNYSVCREINQKEHLPTIDSSSLMPPRVIGMGRQGKHWWLYGFKSLS